MKNGPQPNTDPILSPFFSIPPFLFISFLFISSCLFQLFSIFFLILLALYSSLCNLSLTINFDDRSCMKLILLRIRFLFLLFYLSMIRLINEFQIQISSKKKYWSMNYINVWALLIHGSSRAGIICNILPPIIYLIPNVLKKWKFYP